MIHCNQLPATDPVVRRLREWLNLPAAREYLEWVSSVAAAKTAEAGNKMVSGEDYDKIEAEKIAAEARRYTHAYDVMKEARNPDTKLSFFTLQPKPATLIE